MLRIRVLQNIRMYVPVYRERIYIYVLLLNETFYRHRVSRMDFRNVVIVKLAICSRRI